jgi:hypothetical protein
MGTFDDDKIEEMEFMKGKLSKEICCYSVIGLPLLVWGVMIFWMVQNTKMIWLIDEITCAFSTIAADILHGVNYESAEHTLQFAGIKGFEYLLGEVRTEFGFYHHTSVDVLKSKNFTHTS